MAGEPSNAEARLAAMERDEAVRMLDTARDEFAAALQRHRANELHLAKEIRETQRQLMQARDTIHHMERSAFWRARRLWVRLRGRS
jgi:hypothetical protein